MSSCVIDPYLENCKYVVPNLYLCDDRYYLYCWADYEGNEDCLEVDEKMVDGIIQYWYNLEYLEEEESIYDAY